MQQSIITMKAIKKKFGTFYALKGVDLDIYAGEIHALMGENGAGKSTLMKILAGSYKASEGQIFIDGQECIIQKPQDAIDAGIALIYQEINLSPNLTVAENIFMGREVSHKGIIDRKWMRQEAQKLLTRLNANFRADQKTWELTIAEQQQVEIARALHRESRVLVMDEPTAALSSRETEVLFDRIKKLRAEGIAIIYISHRMAEIYELADRVTVLRDGSSVGGLMRDELNAEKLVHMMVGRSLNDLFERGERETLGSEVLKVKNLSDGGKHVKPVDLTVRSKEIVGLSGLVGSGRTELARLIFGADKLTSGEIYIEDKQVTINCPQQAMEHKIGYLPENRKEQGLFLQLSVKDNIIANHIVQDSFWGILNRKKGRSRAQDVIKLMGIRLSSMFIPVDGLSGGNQQKTLFARWAENHPKLLILDEPTRGVDVGAKADIYRSIHALAHEGCAILLISSELPEIIGMCDRVYVMREGEVAGELPTDQISQENIMQLATGAASLSVA